MPSATDSIGPNVFHVNFFFFNLKKFLFVGVAYFIFELWWRDKGWYYTLKTALLLIIMKEKNNL